MGLKLREELANSKFLEQRNKELEERIKDLEYVKC
jgi:hypothetical protein